MILNDPQFVAHIQNWGGEFRPDQPLREYTSLGVGGAADIIVLRNADAVEPVADGLRQRGIGWGLLGGGTNVLPVDEPLRKIFLHLAPASDLVFEGTRVHVPA